ncbi:hypothetical protein N7528_009115 [Penicillium herquei]|nr:hypothetical protein N7528_009115 [Penicillium herquei]
MQDPAPRDGGGGGGDDDRQGQVSQAIDPIMLTNLVRQAAHVAVEVLRRAPVPTPATGRAPRVAAGVTSRHAAPVRVRVRAPAALPAPNEPQVTAPAPVPGSILDFEGMIARLQAEFEQRIRTLELQVEELIASCRRDEPSKE